LCPQVLTDSAIPVSIEDREQLIQAATTSLSSKIVGQNSGLLAPMAVDCLMKVLDPQRPDLLDLKDVKVGGASCWSCVAVLQGTGAMCVLCGGGGVGWCVGWLGVGGGVGVGGGRGTCYLGSSSPAASAAACGQPQGGHTAGCPVAAVLLYSLLERACRW
jgi:hypothetical protein